MAHKIPKEIDGIPVVEGADSPTLVKGEEWMTMMPKDISIDRIWEFSLTTGRILDMTAEVYGGNDDAED